MRKVVATILLLALVASLAMPIVVTALDSGLFVTTTTEVDAFQELAQRRVFYSDGRIWVFYNAGNNFGYRSSSDGVYWSEFTQIQAPSSGADVEVYFNGTRIHYARWPGGNDFAYRQGDPETNGTITWAAAEQTVACAGVAIAECHVGLTVDSDGQAMILYRASGGGLIHVVANANTNGTWSTDWDTEVGSTEASVNTQLAAMTNGYVIASWHTEAGGDVKYRVYNGTGWETEGTIAGLKSEYSVSAYGDVVTYTSRGTQGDPYVHWAERDAGGSWTDGIVSEAERPTFPVHTQLGGGDIRMFTMGQTVDHIWYRDRISGTWDTEWTDWLNGNDLNIPSYYTTCSYYTQSNITVFAYVTGIWSPYEVRVALLGAAGPSNLVGYATGTGITLAWLKGLGANNTVVRYSDTSYPTTISSGTLVYNGTAASIYHEDLIPGTNYYYSAWSESDGFVSDDYETLVLTTPAISDPGDELPIPATPSTWLSAPNYTRMSNMLFIYDGINGGADSLGMPRETAWFLLYMVLTLVVGLLFYLKARSLMAGIIAITAVLFLGWILQLVPMWVPIITLVLLITLAVTHREVRT